MYHPQVVEERIALTERRFGFRLHRYSREESLYVSKRLESEKSDPHTGKYSNLTPDEQLFIQNEILMSRCDFRYYTRYVQLLLDSASGEKGPLQLWSAQERLIKKIGDVEKEMHDYYRAGRERLDGNCWYVHKCGQRGLSSVIQAIGIHRTNFYSGMSGLAASTNEDKTDELWQNYGYFIYTNLPTWMQSTLISDTQESGIQYSNDSKVVLQNFAQKSGLGQGAKWHWAHLTECATWEPYDSVVDQVENHFMNRVSRSIKGMAFLESTSQGSDDWWDRTTNRARRGEMERWRYYFVPWYAVREISIDYPPEGWIPKPETLREEQLVVRTSPEWCDGQTYHPTLEQLYWWERTRSNYERAGTLWEFDKNHPTTPEQSFVVGGRCSFPYETITSCESTIREPLAYYDLVFDRGQQLVPSELILDEYINPLLPNYKWIPHTVGVSTIAPVRILEKDRLNPLGLIRVWERPEDLRKQNVYGSVDAAGGINNWSRLLQKPDEKDLDNGSIQILRHGMDTNVQVACFTAPVTPKHLARVFNVFARWIYGVNSLDGQIPLIIELSADGKSFQNDLVADFDWFNFYQHTTYSDGEFTETQYLGYPTGGTGVRMAWTAFKERVCTGKVIIRARSTVSEMRNCQDDAIYLAMMTRGKTSKGGGRHDDETYALMYGVWQADQLQYPPMRPTSGHSKTVYDMQLPQSGAPAGVNLQCVDWLPEQKRAYEEDQWSRFMENVARWDDQPR